MQTFQVFQTDEAVQTVLIWWYLNVNLWMKITCSMIEKITINIYGDLIQPISVQPVFHSHRFKTKLHHQLCNSLISVQLLMMASYTWRHHCIILLTNNKNQNEMMINNNDVASISVQIFEFEFDPLWSTAPDLFKTVTPPPYVIQTKIRYLYPVVVWILYDAERPILVLINMQKTYQRHYLRTKFIVLKYFP